MDFKVVGSVSNLRNPRKNCTVSLITLDELIPGIIKTVTAHNTSWNFILRPGQSWTQRDGDLVCFLGNYNRLHSQNITSFLLCENRKEGENFVFITVCQSFCPHSDFQTSLKTFFVCSVLNIKVLRSPSFFPLKCNVTKMRK